MKWLALAVMVCFADAAFAQAPAEPADGPVWHGTVSLSNLYDGNINHEVTPTRSVGIVPAALLTFASSAEPLFEASYEIAANSYTGTDEWDRVSHSLSGVLSYRLGRRLRFETGGTSSWKGSSEDREVANEFGVSQRIAYRLVSSLRLIVLGVYRYKQYPDEPETSGPSPYAGMRIDQKWEDGARLSIGYKYQVRQSQSVRDRYARSAYSVEFSRPLVIDNDLLSFEVEYRRQRYERLIRVENGREWRTDRRILAGVAYELPTSARTAIRWTGGFETRSSNDPEKHFFAPTVGMNFSYRLR